MKSKGIVVFICIYLFLYGLNYLTPMSFGDDYVYSFIWQGHSLYLPLTDDASRISSWHDLFISQLSHYLTWSGRTVNHTLAQFFLWAGKDVFNFFNAFAGTILVAEIYWCIHKGEVTLNFKSGMLCWAFFVIWSFTPGFSPVFFWLDGACNYLWTTIILLAFIMPYIHKYYYLSEKIERQASFSMVMFFGGLFVGWTNENSICWIILVLVFFLIVCKKRGEAEGWMYAGITGLIIGYSLLMLAPGNTVRLYAEQNGFDWLSLPAIKERVKTLLMVFLLQFLLWYFCLRSLFSLNAFNQNDDFKKRILMTKIHCIVAFGMSVIMIISPGFPPRSGFPGTIQLVIAAGILLSLQKDYGFSLLEASTKKFLTCIGVVYFIMTSVITLHGFYKTHLQMNELISSIQNMPNEEKKDILVIQPLKMASKKEEYMSGYHLLSYELSEDENDWKNVSFARYYGVKGIRSESKDIKQK